MSKTLAATSGVQKAAQTVNDLATQITDSDAGLLLLFDDSQEGLSALHWRGVSDVLGKKLRSFIMPVPVPAPARTLRAPRLLTAEGAEETFGPEWRPVFASFLSRHRATALVPLVVDEAAVGFLILGKHGTDYGDQELKLIAVASSQAATVLRSASSYERRIGQRDLELSAVYELMQKVRAATTLEEALSSILDIVASLVWSDDSSLLTVDEDGQTMTVRAARGERADETIGRGTLSLGGDSIAARALRARTGLIASDTAGGGEAPRSRSRMAIPLVVADELIGVLMMESRTPDLYTEESVMMLHLVASQAATIYREMTSLRNLTRYTDNILRSIAAGVITVDKNGYVVTWNKRAEEIVNLRAAEVIGKHYRQFIKMLKLDKPVREETTHMVELTAQTGKVFSRSQLCYPDAQGEETYINLSASQLRSEAGDSLGVVVIFEDVTNEVQMKEEVERVSKLAETGQLAANIAHELRNPLSSIKGAAQLLRRGLPEDVIAEHGEFLDMIVQEVNGLDRIATEFLEFSRVTPPEMRPVRRERRPGPDAPVHERLPRRSGGPSRPGLRGGPAGIVSGPPADRAGDQERRHQRRPGHAARRHAVRHHAAPGTGRHRGSGLHRHGRRHPGGEAGQDLRPVLHHQDQGDRAGAGDRPQDHRDPRGPAADPQRARRGVHVHDAAPRPPDARRHGAAVADRDHRPAQRPARPDL